jgi:hypothetical protein
MENELALNEALEAGYSLAIFESNLISRRSVLLNPNTNPEEARTLRVEFPKFKEEYGRLHQLLSTRFCKVPFAHIKESQLEDLFDLYRVAVEYPIS